MKQFWKAPLSFLLEGRDYTTSAGVYSVHVDLSELFKTPQGSSLSALNTVWAAKTTDVLNTVLFQCVCYPNSPWFGRLTSLRGCRHCRRGILCTTHIQKP